MPGAGSPDSAFNRMASLPKRKTPWGLWRVLFKGNRFQVKHIVVSPRQRFSLQYHKRRTEDWIIVAGRGKLTAGNRIRMVQAGDSIFIPALQKHRLHNTGRTPLIFIEVQQGAYLGEDDIIRLQDDYGRT